MTARNRRLINVLSTGVLVTLVTLVMLFWGRWYCHLLRLDATGEGTRQVQVSPMGLFPFEKADDPNLVSPSSATAKVLGPEGLLSSLGAPQYIRSHLPGGPDSYVYQWRSVDREMRLYFDPSPGLMVYSRRIEENDPNGAIRRRYVTQYAGPEGIAERPDEKLGRFVSPITDGFYANNPQTVYDNGYRCFFSIRWRDGLVKKGPEFTEDDARPIQIGVLQKCPLTLSLGHRYPIHKERENATEHYESMMRALHTQLAQMESYPVLVLNARGQIDLLNPNTLELKRNVAALPKPPTLFRSDRAMRPGPKALAAYGAYPFAPYDRQAQKRFSYGGCIAAAVSPDLTGLEINVFDPNGQIVAARDVYPGPHDLYFSLPDASLITVVQHIIENLHPLASLALSSVAARHVPATSAYKSLVLLPNSFAAMAARDSSFGPVNRIGTSVLLMLPAIILGVVLAWLVSRDAVRMGLSRQATSAWIIATFALGLPAYVTYRLTRPRAALVTCPNCGLGRRPDFEKCQRCKAPWLVPELVPPTWRVIGEPEEQPCDATPAPNEQTSSAAEAEV
jgi:hypothetical protein